MNRMEKCLVRKEPKGVVLIIGAWNYPVQLLLLPLVGAIAAGNTVILKPSEVSANTSNVICRYLLEYLDPRAFQIVAGAVEETTVLLREQFDHIFYTGNGAVGKIVMAAAAKHLTPVTLELGGKSPAIICPDVNVSIAASRIVWGKFYNAGQTCIAPDYVLITKDKYEAFIAACQEVLQERFGDNPQLSDSYGRLINERRLNAVKQLLDGVDPTKIITGGVIDKDDLYMSPTIVGPISPNEPGIMDEEIFGPVLPVVPVDDIDEAIRIVNSKTRNWVRKVILNNTTSGGALVNDVLMHAQELGLPFGGIGPSGLGCYHGKRSFDIFTHERATMIRSLGMESAMEIRYPPYTDDKAFVSLLLTMGLPDSFFGKIKAIIRGIKSVSNVLTKGKPVVDKSHKL
ncbi:Aldehyde/histidinol dehydrogenase [Pilobolus umbonatus]|nr:Aldehyde/histidinol dehydrogenase [Pilobolus umbonatus]